jgi:hypothetical protein
MLRVNLLSRAARKKIDAREKINESRRSPYPYDGPLTMYEGIEDEYMPDDIPLPPAIRRIVEVAPALIAVDSYVPTLEYNSIDSMTEEEEYELKRMNKDTDPRLVKRKT